MIREEMIKQLDLMIDDLNDDELEEYIDSIPEDRECLCINGCDYCLDIEPRSF